MQKSKLAVLNIDYDQDNAAVLSYMLTRAGYAVVTCRRSDEGLNIAGRGGFAIIIMEFRQHGMSGTDLCAAIRKFDQKTPIMFFSASASLQERKAGLNAGAEAYLVKPDDLDKLVFAVKRLIDKKYEPVSDVEKKIIEVEINELEGKYHHHRRSD